MKLNKLLTPILGVATLSSVVAPIATSCTTETSTAHVKVSPKSEEVNSKGGIATYLLVLDSSDYDEHGFQVTATVSKDDKTGVVSDDFEYDWEIDGDHLTVTVTYKGEYVPENDVVVKLNINVSYGTEWKESLPVKFGYETIKGTPMKFYENWGCFYSDYGTLTDGETYIYSIDCSKLASLVNRPNWFGWYYDSSSTSLAHFIYSPAFESVTVTLNGKVIEPGDKTYEVSTGDICPEGSVTSLYFYDLVETIKSTDTLLLTFNKCHIYGAIMGRHTLGTKYDKLENAYAGFEYWY